MNLNFRVIGKFFFLLVVIGFFMPMGCDQNGFQLADSGMLDSSGVFVIYASLDYNTQSEIINFDAKNPEITFKISVLGVGKIKLEKQKEFV